MTAPMYPEVVVHFDTSAPDRHLLLAKVSFEMWRVGQTPEQIVEFRDAMSKVMNRAVQGLIVASELDEAVYLAATGWVTLRCGFSWISAGAGEFWVERINRDWRLYSMPEFNLVKIGRSSYPGELVGDFPTLEAAHHHVLRS